jgi:hypothetical protein
LREGSQFANGQDGAAVEEGFEGFVFRGFSFAARRPALQPEEEEPAGTVLGQ